MNPAATQPAPETVAPAPLGRMPDRAAARAFERLLGEARMFDPLAQRAGDEARAGTLRHRARPGT